MKPDIAQEIRSEITKQLPNDFYLSHAKIEKWPDGIGVVDTIQTSGFIRFESKKVRGVNFPNSPKIFGQTLRSYKLKCRNLQSHEFDPSDKDAIQTAIHGIVFVVTYLWRTAFRNDIVRLSDNRMVVRKFTDDLIRKDIDSTPTIAVHEAMPRKVNLFGKQVNPYLDGVKCNGSVLTKINPRYKKAATQIIGWHPHIATFLFTEPENWFGKFELRQITGESKSFIDATFQYAARPEMTHLGYVITVVPKGLRGFFWYWIWKMIRFVP